VTTTTYTASPYSITTENRSTRNIRPFLAWPWALHRPAAFGSGPPMPPPPPENSLAGEPAGHASTDSQGTPGNGSATARFTVSAENMPAHFSQGEIEGILGRHKAEVEKAEKARRKTSERAAAGLPWKGNAERKLVIKNAATIEPAAVSWLWRGWIAKGFINIVAGETGAGKSTVLADIVARETTGAPWPGENERRRPGQVLWLGSEDPPALMTVPRLIASGANREHVNFIDGAQLNGSERSISLQEDLHSMADALDDARDQGDPISMIVIDPVTSYLSGGVLKKVDMNDAGQIRTVLEPWSKLASFYNVAVVCVTHFAKDTNRSMLHRVLGTGAFTALGRSTIAITTLPEPAQNGNRFAKAMFQIKMNLTEQPYGAWRFSTSITTVFNSKNEPIPATRVDWEELDSALTPQSMIGNERGPVSQYGVVFPNWLRAQFVATPLTEGLMVADVKRRAIADGVATERWWNEHSQEYLEKRNVGGVWQCRPKS